MAEKHELAYQDYQNGMKYKDIAEKYDVSIDTVKNWKRRNWPRDDIKKGVKGDTKIVTPNKKVSLKKDNKEVHKNLLVSVEQNEQLTDKQRLFCLCYIKNFNATQAAINAGYTDNYPSEIGYQLLQKTTVRNEIMRLKGMKAQSLLATQEDIVERYMHIAFADMGNYAEWDCEEQPVLSWGVPVMVEDENTGEKVPVIRMVNAVRLKESSTVDTSLVHKIKQGKDGVSIELIDSMKAMAWLDKYFLMNPLDKHKIDYDNARLAIEKHKSESSLDDDKPIEIIIKRATKPPANDAGKTDNITKNGDA